MTTVGDLRRVVGETKRAAGGVVINLAAGISIDSVKKLALQKLFLPKMRMTSKLMTSNLFFVGVGKCKFYINVTIHSPTVVTVHISTQLKKKDMLF